MAQVSSSWLMDKLQSYRGEKQKISSKFSTIASAIFSLVWCNQKMVLKSWLSLRVWIAEGLLAKSNWFWSTGVLKSVSLLFEGWFARGKWLAICAYVWFFDRGKLVIRCHSQVTRVVRRTRNGFGKLTPYSAVASSFKQIFKMSQFGARVAEMF